jgi:hypothetical protein
MCWWGPFSNDGGGERWGRERAFDGRIVFVHKVTLDELNGESGFAYAWTGKMVWECKRGGEDI